ncbi:hypothetical protein EZV73_26240 [Acidaminobacter sp. JC074]|uniref:DUF6648 family protein n=1 Tax=Acidaminobacter sp. JC074 TaxID=2530199 RepID=UPI001F1088CB|nr:DUF6648 family protein [Acidaminobacter sp. JC074]MCH4891105.1 hypothetical protein [Acidaminobacter sp. JC074]
MSKQACDLMERFFKNRDELIDKYTNGRMSKTAFIEENYKFITDLNISPFSGKLDFSQCIYNYQYYNIMAKYANLQAQDCAYFDPKGAEAYKEEEFEYYKYKDEATLSLLELVDYKSVEAYFMHMQSNRLDGKLFEVVFKDFNRAIFHSMNPKILKRLREHRVFSPVYKDSVIHSYVNSVY